MILFGTYILAGAHALWSGEQEISINGNLGFQSNVWRINEKETNEGR